MIQLQTHPLFNLSLFNTESTIIFCKSMTPSETLAFERDRRLRQQVLHYHNNGHFRGTNILPVGVIVRKSK